jgi:hypothetical protein
MSSDWASRRLNEVLDRGTDRIGADEVHGWTGREQVLGKSPSRAARAEADDPSC